MHGFVDWFNFFFIITIDDGGYGYARIDDEFLQLKYLYVTLGKFLGELINVVREMETY